jgi:hypothetical protein
MSVDEVNVLRYTRGLQLSLPFLTGYEAYIIDQVIEALERNIALEKEKKAVLSAPVSKTHAARAEDKAVAKELYRDLQKSVKDLTFVLSVAFCNRNVSRILVQQMVRYDILWHLNSQFNWYVCIFVCVCIYKYIYWQINVYFCAHLYIHSLMYVGPSYVTRLGSSQFSAYRSSPPLRISPILVTTQWPLYSVDY